MKDYTIFSEMTIDEIEAFLETGEVPVRKEVNGKLPKDTGFHKGQGETPMRDNTVPTKKGQDPVKPENGDEDEFMKELDASDIKKEACKTKKVKKEEKDEECCAKDKKDCTGECKKKKPVEPNEVDEDSETLEEDFDIDAEYDALIREEDEELDMFDEELNDIESFLENYETFMED